MTQPEVVAWMDDGQQAANGTEGPDFRVVTEKTRRDMPRAAVAAYTEPLIRLSDYTAYAARVRAEAMEEAAKLCDSAIPPGCSTSMVDVSRIQGIKHCAALIRLLIDAEAAMRSKP